MLLIIWTLPAFGPLGIRVAEPLVVNYELSMQDILNYCWYADMRGHYAGVLIVLPILFLGSWHEFGGNIK